MSQLRRHCSTSSSGGLWTLIRSYNSFFTAISDTTELLDLIKGTCRKGVFPTAKGWYRDGESHLDGDFEAFEDLFEEINEPRNGGSKQSRLRAKLNKYEENKAYLRSAPGTVGKFVTAVSRYQTRLPSRV